MTNRGRRTAQSVATSTSRPSSSTAIPAPASSRSPQPSRSATSAISPLPIRPVLPPPALQSATIPRRPPTTRPAPTSSPSSRTVRQFSASAISARSLPSRLWKARPSSSRNSPASTFSTSKSTPRPSMRWSMSSPRWSRPSAASTLKTSRRRSALRSNASCARRWTYPSSTTTSTVRPSSSQPPS